MGKKIKKNKKVFVFVIVFAVLFGGYFGMNYYYTQQIKEFIYNNMEDQQGFKRENLVFKDINGNFFTNNVEIEGMKYEHLITKGYKLINTVDSIELNDFKHQDDIITNMDIKFKGIAVASENKGEIPFQATIIESVMQYVEPFKFDVMIDQNYSPKNETFKLKNNQVVIYPISNPQAYTDISIGASAGNIKAKMLENQNNPKMIRNITLDYFGVKIYDKGENIKRIISKLEDYGSYKVRLLKQLNMANKQFQLPRLKNAKTDLFNKLDKFIRNNFALLNLKIDFGKNVTISKIMNGQINDDTVKITNFR